MHDTDTAVPTVSHAARDNTLHAKLVALSGVAISLTAAHVLTHSLSPGVTIEGILGIVFGNMVTGWGGFLWKSAKVQAAKT